MQYNVHEIEKKWQTIWSQEPVGQSKPVGSGKKYYCLDMFPYPSGSGLHVGHWKGYVLSDVYARIKWLQGYNVLHPMGWDAFGLPAENDAIKKGINPAVSTAANIAHFKKQLEQVGALYDWTKEINTSDPGYYKWTQWIFLKMFKAGLAYEAVIPINWCPSCLTGLANEEVINEGHCERCSTRVMHKDVRQWVLKITKYADKLLTGLDRLEWPEKVKTMQRNWIGKSEGVEIIFATQVTDGSWVDLPIFTTTPSTLYGVTFIVMAPDHDLVGRIVSPEHYTSVMHYQDQFNSMTGTERLTNMHEKTGIFTGTFAVNPLTKQQIPIYLANYVLKEYGTGIVMGVPAHDQRDFEFAQSFGLPIKQVIKHDHDFTKAYEGSGPLINSGQFDGLQAPEKANKAIGDYLTSESVGVQKTTYKLRDWVFSRQRYWGEPIPVIHCPECGVVPVPEDQLPVTLPYLEKYQPTGTGESPLAAVTDWVNVPCPDCGKPAKRETNTMPQWAGSCWYFLRYPNPHLSTEAFSKKDMEYWLPVDLYVGGIEHAILHLLYSRFYIKVLHDLGYLQFDEPFSHLFNQGMITKYSEKSGLVEKMSKSKGNVVNPDDIVKKYGSDVLRMYILFMGPPEMDCEWQDTGLEGIKRFLIRLWNYLTKPDVIVDHETKEATKSVHTLIKLFQERVDHFKPNTAIAAFMEFSHQAASHNFQFTKESIEKLCTILSTMAPHMASELLEKVLHKKLQDCSWPSYDPRLTAQETVVIAIQVNGKMRGTIEVGHDAKQEVVEDEARLHVHKWLAEGTVKKIIFVSNKLINFIL